ncbi:hypothetical protein BC940DRAFT_146618 [Gongronella butleri]|nr:hypothetical protein BC940DRAFT_146618 [Gongronella butleri]
MSLCLDQLLEQKKTAPFTLVNDSIQCAGVPLLAAFVQKALALDQQVICVLTETSPRRWLQHLKQSPGSPHRHLFIMDAFSDPEGWDKEHVLQPQQQRITLDRNMERQILPTIINRIEQAPNTLIVIDSLSPLSLISSHRTFQLVKALVSFTSGTMGASVFILNTDNALIRF